MALRSSPMMKSVFKEQLDDVQTLQASRGIWDINSEVMLSKGRETDGRTGVVGRERIPRTKR